MRTRASKTPFEIHSLLANLASYRPLFHSEADFQHAFVWELHLKYPDALIRLEKPISTDRGLVHLDVLFQHGNAIIPIELKYKTRKFPLAISGETYSLRNHSAQDLGRYDFIKDITRLEAITTSLPGALGYAILLTNEGSYWKGKSGKHTVDAAFRLHEGRILAGECAWHKRASAGTTKKREKPMYLGSSYTLEWRDYSSPSSGKGSVFRYLAVPVRNGG